jgi:outer membrane protein TolC
MESIGMNTASFASLPWRTTLLAATLSLALAGCAVSPNPLKDDEVKQRVQADQLTLYVHQEPITKPITFNDALARAIKYNLDYRLKEMESALASGLHDVSRYDMLPKMLVSAGYDWRSNDSGGTSVGIETHEISLIPSSSVERDHGMASATFSWNLLDFGMSYFRAQESANQFMIAEERRRRVMQSLLQDLRTSYWRALGAQRLSAQADSLLARVYKALGKSREAEAQGLLPPVQALQYQSALLDTISLLNARRQDLEVAKRELAALMTIPPGMPFTLADEKEPPLPGVPTNLAQLEDIALQARPELREEDYRKRISAEEARRQITALLPGINFDVGPQYDSNKYLYNSSWIEGGVSVSLNLFRLAAMPAVMAANKAQIGADDARRLALSMAILTQLRVAVERYRMSLIDLDLADEGSRVDQRMAKYARATLTTHTDSELEAIRTESRALLAEFQRYSAYASAQAAFGRIYNSVGLDVLPTGGDTGSIADLSKKLDTSLHQSERSNFLDTGALAQVTTPIQVKLENIANTGATPEMMASITRALVRNRFTIVADASQGTPATLVMRLKLDSPRDGVRHASWDLRIHSPEGQELARDSYASTLRADPSHLSLADFSEAAAVAEIDSLHRVLGPEAGNKVASNTALPAAIPQASGPKLAKVVAK